MKSWWGDMAHWNFISQLYKENSGIQLDFSSAVALIKTPYWTPPPAPLHLSSSQYSRHKHIIVACLWGFFAASIAVISRLIGLSRSLVSQGEACTQSVCQRKLSYVSEAGVMMRGECQKQESRKESRLWMSVTKLSPGSFILLLSLSVTRG